MAFNLSGKSQNDAEEVPLPSYVPTPSAQAVLPVTVIAKGVRIEGDFGGDGDMRIDGEVSGKLTVGGTLTIGSGAIIKAEVKAGSVVMSGTIEGNITVDARLELKATAKMKGDMKARELTVEPGASIHGTVIVGEDNRQAQTKMNPVSTVKESAEVKEMKDQKE